MFTKVPCLDHDEFVQFIVPIATLPIIIVDVIEFAGGTVAVFVTTYFLSVLFN